MVFRAMKNDTDDLLADVDHILGSSKQVRSDSASLSDFRPTPTPGRTQRPLFLPGPSRSPILPLPAPSPSVPLTSDQLEYLPQAQTSRREIKKFKASDTEPDETSQYGDDIWEDDVAVFLAQQVEQSYTSQGPPVEPPVVIENGIHEPVATPEVLQQRVKSDLEFTNTRGQKELSIKVIDEKFRPLFPYRTFNAMQSVALQTAHRSSENFVLSAPTSAGKTTVFELAFLRMVKEWAGYPEQRLAIYIAPTKALCYERATDWAKRLPSVDPSLKCVQLTGDTSRNDDTFNLIRNASLIVTTPEKWDSVTRRSSDSQKLLDRVSLVMIDEVHILCESRGATLEVVVSRMKALGRQIRFVAVSASVPNIDDVARWLASPPEEVPELGVYEAGGGEAKSKGENNFSESQEEQVKSPVMAKVLKFGEDYRPVPLKKLVRGYEATNQWALGPQLDKSLFPELLNLQSIAEHRGKPVLVFCPTRKACQTTAEYINEMYDQQVQARGLLPWTMPFRYQDEVEKLSDPVLNKWAENGIAAHHAGLEVSDRHLIENWFKEGRLKMIICTSTLAVGVNLPAHTVVIKGTMTYSGPITGFREYSDIEIQQMMGRAGRPQFDSSGVVLLMCEKSREAHYRDMINSKTVLESRLHDHLTEHINSEIGRKTITDLRTAQDWLRNSFLFVRIKQNPQHYAIPDVNADSSGRTMTAWDQWLKWFVEEALDRLEQHELVTHDSGRNAEEDRQRKSLEITPFGAAMSKHCISYGTMCSILGITEKFTFRDLLEVLCGATEFADLRARPGEIAVLNKVRNKDPLRFKLKEPVKTYADKVFIHLQLQFVGTTLEEAEKETAKTENANSRQILGAIAQSAPRIANAIFAVCTLRDFGQTSKYALELLHTVEGMAWEDHPAVFRQLDNVGPKSILVLASHRITTFQTLRDTPAPKINGLLGRQGMFGEKLHSQIDKLPRYEVEIQEDTVCRPEPNENPKIILNIHIKCLSSEDSKNSNDSKAKGKKKKTLKWQQFWNKTLTLLVLRSDGRLVGNMSMPARNLNAKSSTMALSAEFTSPQQTVIAYIGANEVSGLLNSTTYNPELPSDFFPPEPIRPEGQDGNDESAAAAENAGRLPNGNFPCAHQCRDRSICNHVCCKEGVKRGGRPASFGQKSSSIRTAVEIASELDEKIRTSKKRQAPRISMPTLSNEDILVEDTTAKPSLSGPKSQHLPQEIDGEDATIDTSVTAKSKPSKIDGEKERVKSQVEDLDDEEWNATIRKKLKKEHDKKRSRDSDEGEVAASARKPKFRKKTLLEELDHGLDDEIASTDTEDQTYLRPKHKVKDASSSSDVDPLKLIRQLERSGLVSNDAIAAMKAKVEKESILNDHIEHERLGDIKDWHKNGNQSLPSPADADLNFKPSSPHSTPIKTEHSEATANAHMKSEDWLNAMIIDDQWTPGATSTVSPYIAHPDRIVKQVVDDFEMLFGEDDSIVME